MALTEHMLSVLFICLYFTTVLKVFWYGWIMHPLYSYGLIIFLNLNFFKQFPKKKKSPRRRYKDDFKFNNHKKLETAFWVKLPQIFPVYLYSEKENDYQKPWKVTITNTHTSSSLTALSGGFKTSF